MRRGLSTQLVNARLLSRVNRPPNAQDIPGDYCEMVARNRHAPQIATQRISFKPVPGVKANQAWKYPGYNIVRAAGTTLNGRFYTDPKHYETDDMKATAAALQGEQPAADADGAPRRKQESNFLITINPNQQYHGDSVPRAEKAFETALQHLHDRTILWSAASNSAQRTSITRTIAHRM